jgi:hypothetical protein
MSFVAVAIGGSAIAGIAGSAIGAHAAGQAANAQTNAANYAANLQHSDAQAALANNQAQFNTTQQNLAPWLTTGTSAQANLASLMGVLPTDAQTAGLTPKPLSTPNAAGGYAGMDFNSVINSGDPNVSPNAETTQQWQAQGVPFHNITTADGRTVAVRDDQSGQGSQGGASASGTASGTVPLSSLVNPSLGAPGSLAADWTGKFVAPTDVTEQNDPGYQFRQNQAIKAIQNSAISRGDLLSGGTAKGLSDYIQNQASQEYGNVYNRAFNDYSTSYNTFKQNQADKYNRLAALAGGGQVTASTLGQLGANSSSNTSNILLNSGQQIGNNINNAGAARASGYVGAGNSWASGLTGAANNISLLSLLNRGGGPSLDDLYNMPVSQLPGG